MIYRRAEGTTPMGTGYLKEGDISVSSTYNGEFNAEAIVGYTNRFSDAWSVSAFAGWNSMIAWNETVSAYGSRFIQPDFSVIGNTETTSGGKSRWENYINSIMGQAEVSYKNLLFLTLSGRNDWFSALSLRGKSTPNNIFYPSVGAGLVVDSFSESERIVGSVGWGGFTLQSGFNVWLRRSDQRVSYRLGQYVDNT